MKIVYYSSLVVFLFLFACDDSFNPFGEFEKKHSVYCVLNLDSTNHIVTITEDIFSDDLNIDNVKTDSFVKNADVKIFYEDSIYTFHDSTTTIVRDGEKRNISFFYLKNVKFSRGNEINLSIKLENGRKLRSKIYPSRNIFGSFNTSKVIHDPNEEVFKFSWDYNSEEIIGFLPSLIIKYFAKVSGKYVEKEIEIPTEIYYEDKKLKEIFPRISSRSIINYQNSAIKKTLERISEIEENNSGIVIKNITGRVMVMNEELTRYNSSLKTFLDNFTIKLNPADYSNIHGGQGIFGFIFVLEMQINFWRDYIDYIEETLGYTYNAGFKLPD